LISEYNGEILLETGTNEMEIMVFTIGNNSFGINVAKVREIMMPIPVTQIPHSHPAVEGVFKPRDMVITVVDLPKYLGFPTVDESGRSLLILTNFNKMHAAFRVHSVVGINRISWEAIQKPDKIVYGGSDGVATGIAQCSDGLITILDFEKIIADISPDTSIQLSDIESIGERHVDNRNIVVAEDSKLLSKMIFDCLHKAGYMNITSFDNGQETWDYLENLEVVPDILDKVSLIITDIEMPKMDGHRLINLVKSNQNLKKIPIIIFSSLIDEQMEVKGKEVGADAQISKPEIVNLINIIDGLRENRK